MRRVMLVLAVMAVGALVLAQGSSSSGNASNGSSGSSNASSSNASVTAPNFTAATTLPDTVVANWALVQGEWREVLTDSQGRTLYYNDQDTASKSTCTGSCTALWKPLLLGKNMPVPTGDGNLTAYLDTLNGPDGGTMVSLKGHPLYTFSKDQLQGEALGVEENASHWHVATPALVQYG